MSDWVLPACLASVALGAWLARVHRLSRERRRARDFNRRGQLAERDAIRLLEIHGYAIVARQLRTAYSITLDGATQQQPLVIDFVVERRGERLPAEVKSGPRAAQLDHPETRRQLLEYQLAMDSNAVLLVDPERQRIRRVAFPIKLPPVRRRSRLPLLAASSLLLAVAAAAAWIAAR